MSEKIPLYTTSGYAVGCDCPIHAEGRPFVAPLGMHFEDEVQVEDISADVAEEIHLAHHSYMARSTR